MPDYTASPLFVAITQQLGSAPLPEAAAFLVWQAATLRLRGRLPPPDARRVVALIDALLLGPPPDEVQKQPRAA